MNIKRIDIVHHSHWNPTEPDHPAVAMRLQKQYLDRALEIMEKNQERGEDDCFRWTVEGFLPLLEWWQEADADKKARFAAAVKNGWLDVGGFPGNMSPFTSAREWDSLFDRIPQDFRNIFRFRSVMQSGTGGVSAQGMIRAYKNGVRYLWASAARYTDGGDVTPRYFNWKLSACHRAFVWVNPSFGNACSLLFGRPAERRKLDHTDPAFSGSGEAFFSFQKEALKSIHAGLCDRLENDPVYRQVRHSTLPVSFTDLAGADNDPPLEWLSDFVAAWNRLGLQPRLRLSTVSQAVASVEVEVLNNRLPTFTGEWADDRVEPYLRDPALLQAACDLRRKIDVLSVLGPSPADEATVRDALSALSEYALAGSGISPGVPGAIAEQSAKLDFAAAARCRALCPPGEKGIFLSNPASRPFSDWVTVPAAALSSDIRTLRRSDNRQRIPLFRDADRARFWVELASGETLRFLPDSETCPPASSSLPDITADADGFPVRVQWDPQTAIAAESFGTFSAAGLPEGACRFLPAEKESVQTDYGVLVTQSFTHPYLKKGSRTIQIWKNSPRIRVTFDLDWLDVLPADRCRITFSPDVGRTPAILSNAGSVFEPVRGELNDTVCERYVTDGWVAYPYVNLLFITPDLPVVYFDRAVGAGETVRRLDYGEGFRTCVYDPDGQCRPLHQTLRYEFSVEPGLDDFEALIAGFSGRFFPVRAVIRF